MAISSEVLPDNVVTGASLSAKDISVNGFYPQLSERWRGGLSLKFLYSAWLDYTSIGLCVDAGLSYYNSDKGFPLVSPLKNIGAQLKAYEDERQKMPWDIQMGITQKMAHAPDSFFLTAQLLEPLEVRLYR